jgi:hypothetical protein
MMLKSASLSVRLNINVSEVYFNDSWNICLLCIQLHITVEVEVNLWPTVSRPVRLGIGPPFGTLDQIYLDLLFSAENYLIILPKASSLTRKRVCSLQCNHSLVPITILYRLIWDCVPFLSPLTMRRDYGGLHIIGVCIYVYIYIPYILESNPHPF